MTVRIGTGNILCTVRCRKRSNDLVDRFFVYFLCFNIYLFVCLIDYFYQQKEISNSSSCSLALNTLAEM